MALMLSCSETKKATDNPPSDRITSFYNPLLSSGPDPWVYKKDGSFYYMHTMVNSIAIWKTRAISELGKAPVKTVWTPPASGNNAKNIWAPELHFLQGKWYLYYTAGATTNLATQRCFVLENPNPDPTTGTWTDKGKLADPLGDYFAIDGTILEYKDKLYFIWSGQI